MRLGPQTGQSRVFPQLQLPEFHVESVVKDQPATQRFPLAENQLHRLGGLNAADQGRQDAEDAALGAAWHEAWGWGSGYKQR